MSKQTDLINIPDAITVSGSNVGIGTNSATNKLSVESSTVNNNTAFIKNTSGTGVNYGLEIVAGTNATDHSLHVTSSTGTSLLRVNGAGNVGIGTSSPAYKIDVAQVGGDAIRVNGGADFTGIALTSSSGGANTYSMRTASNALFFYDGNASTERLRIDSSGRVTTPSQPAFQAYNTNNGAFGVNAGDTFPLNATRFNIGNCFNTSNYTFTAPVDGYYQLDFMTISTSSQTNLHMNFVFSGNNNMGYNFHFSGNASGGWDTLTMSGVYYMSAGVSVFVRNNTYGITVHGSTWNKFTGYLLG